jgi:hypothetical protein
VKDYPFTALDTMLLLVVFFFCFSITIILILRFVKGKVKIGSVEINGTKKHRQEEDKLNADKSIYIERLLYEVRKEEKIKADTMIKINSFCAEWLKRIQKYIYNTFLTYLQTIAVDKNYTTETYKDYYNEMEDMVKKKFVDIFNLTSMEISEDEYNAKTKEIKNTISTEMLSISKKYDYERLGVNIQDTHEHSLRDSEKWIYISNSLDEVFMGVRAIMCDKNQDLQEAKNKQNEILQNLGVKASI